LGLIASVPVQDAIPIPEGIPITATRAATVVAGALIPLILIRRGKYLQRSLFMVAPLALMGVMVLSLWNATSLGLGYAELYRWLVAVFSFWLVLQIVDSRRMVLAILISMGALAIFQGGMGVVQAILGMGPSSFQVGGGFSRAFGTFGMPNSYAAYLEMVSLPLIPITIWSLGELWTQFASYRVSRVRGYLRSSDERREFLIGAAQTTILAGGAAAGLLGIAMSFSRGGWLGSIAGLVVMIVLLGRRAVITSIASAVGLGLISLLGASGAVLAVLEDRFIQLVDQARIRDISGATVTDDNFAVVERLAHWQTAMAMWLENPWLGVGIGNFNERFTEYSVHPQFFESQGHAHNYYLHALAETGLAGLIFYLLFLGAAFFIGWRAYRSTDPLTRAIGIGAIGMTAALTVHNFFENLHVLNIGIQMMAIWALAIVATRLLIRVPGTEIGKTQRTDMQYDSSDVTDAMRTTTAGTFARERN
ncbi:MAG: O-antigen ligase family protein, partial [Thermomicrobiaceae bacterium]